MIVSTPPKYAKLSDAQVVTLQAVFGDRMQQHTSLARYTSARVGGPADILLQVDSTDELASAAAHLWAWEIPFFVLGGGSNLLISDRGVRGVVLLNRARQVQFNERVDPPSVWAESGAGLGLVARQAALRGLGGLEWAAAIPGTIGGAVVGNAGAHGGDMAGNLQLAEILHLSESQAEPERQQWPLEKLEYVYRSSSLKRNPGKSVVLSALLHLEHSTPESVQARLDQFAVHRRRTQPPGASMGSMFKNPPGDYAGRLIEAAGLKGTQIGGAQISTRHANFFINLGDATAADVYALIQQARQKVAERFGVQLELEIELLGDWRANSHSARAEF